jgi:mannose-6-phosphate isomerase-like protein (cupin superfamily)
MSTQEAQPSTERRPGWDKPDGVSLADWMESRIARFEGRTYDWDALKFQADYDPKYRRAQMRYMGTGAAGVSSDTNTVPSDHFTFSTMVLPAGCEGPMHVHDDVEEVFFMLRGRIRLTCGQGEEEALMCVMLGTPKPVTPTYPLDHPLSSIKRDKK